MINGRAATSGLYAHGTHHAGVETINLYVSTANISKWIHIYLSANVLRAALSVQIMLSSNRAESEASAR